MTSLYVDSKWLKTFLKNKQFVDRLNKVDKFIEGLIAEGNGTLQSQHIIEILIIKFHHAAFKPRVDIRMDDNHAIRGFYIYKSHLAEKEDEIRSRHGKSLQSTLNLHQQMTNFLILSNL